MSVQFNNRHGRTGWDFLSGPFIFILLFFGSSFLVFWGVRNFEFWMYPFLVVPIILPIIILAEYWRRSGNMKLVVVLDDVLKLTEYKVGHKVPLKINGTTIPFTSNTGVIRTVMTEFNPETLEGKGCEIAEYSQLEIVRKLTQHQHLIDKVEDIQSKWIIDENNMGLELNQRMMDHNRESLMRLNQANKLDELDNLLTAVVESLTHDVEEVLDDID